MEVKWYGTAGISITVADQKIVFDPFISFNEANRFLPLEEIAACKHIFITHGHFDHLMHVPDILARGLGKVYCDEIAAGTLMKKGVPARRIEVIKPGDTIELDDFTINILKGDHVVFDLPLIIKTLINRRMVKWAKNLGKVIKCFVKYPRGQVLIYDIMAGGRRILHMGSLGICSDEVYPDSVDLLSLPFQGRSDIEDLAVQFVGKINPRVVFLQHFDDSFPPISNEIDTTGFQWIMADVFPDIKVIKPEYLKSYKWRNLQSREFIGVR